MENWSWNDLRVLLAVYRGGSLLKAGRFLGLSTSTVGRRLDALEQAIGTKLVHRTQNGAELTSSAVRLVRLAEGLETGLQSQQRDRQAIAGTIRISVPDGLAGVVAEAIVPFHRNFPAIDVELIGESRMADVAKREADVALRLVRSTSHFLVEQKVATLRFSLFGAPDYVRDHLNGRALRYGDAAAQIFVGLDPRWAALPQEQWLIRLGASRFAFRSGSIDAVMAVVRQGIGLAALPDETGHDAGLIQIKTEVAGPVQPLYLVCHRDLRHIAHVRAILSLIQVSLLRKPSHEAV
jgi:DNA-binding transcriptional LysR family regulator